uniref:(northern house mosquito) hypothetical protein n=1 Tax=Culex pipiens TaxID=7175 RepID=A0A8D8HMF1_CULPI
MAPSRTGSRSRSRGSPAWRRTKRSGRSRRSGMRKPGPLPRRKRPLSKPPPPKSNNNQRTTEAPRRRRPRKSRTKLFVFFIIIITIKIIKINIQRIISTYHNNTHTRSKKITHIHFAVLEGRMLLERCRIAIYTREHTQNRFTRHKQASRHPLFLFRRK